MIVRGSRIESQIARFLGLTFVNSEKQFQGALKIVVSLQIAAWSDDLIDRLGTHSRVPWAMDPGLKRRSRKGHCQGRKFDAPAPKRTQPVWRE
jgi:hypothetical protein